MTNFIYVLLGVLLIGVVLTALTVRRLNAKQKRLEEANKPEPMAVSLTLSSADTIEEDNEQRIGNQ